MAKIVFKMRISSLILRYLLYLVTWWLLELLLVSVKLTESSWLCKLPDRYLEWMHTVFFSHSCLKTQGHISTLLSLDGYSPAEICYVAICLLTTSILQNASAKESNFFRITASTLEKQFPFSVHQTWQWVPSTSCLFWPYLLSKHRYFPFFSK